jgi:hypothetical protein
MAEYWLSVALRSAINSFDSIGVNWGGAIYSAMVLAMGAFTVFRFYRQEFRDHVLRNVLLVMLMGVVAWVPFFFWHLIRTPYLIQQKTIIDMSEQIRVLEEEKDSLLQAVDRLEENLNQAELSDKLIVSLGELYADGVRLRNGVCVSYSDDCIKRINRWRDTVDGLLRANGLSADAEKFGGVWQSGSPSLDVNRQLETLSAIVSELKK